MKSLEKVSQLPAPLLTQFEQSLGTTVKKIKKNKRWTDMYTGTLSLSLMFVTLTILVIHFMMPDRMAREKTVDTLLIFAGFGLIGIVVGAGVLTTFFSPDYKQIGKISSIAWDMTHLEGVLGTDDRFWKMSIGQMVLACDVKLVGLAGTVSLIEKSRLPDDLKEKYRALEKGEFERLHAVMARIGIVDKPFGHYFKA